MSVNTFTLCEEEEGGGLMGGLSSQLAAIKILRGASEGFTSCIEVKSILENESIANSLESDDRIVLINFSSPNLALVIRYGLKFSPSFIRNLNVCFALLAASKLSVLKVSSLKNYCN